MANHSPPDEFKFKKGQSGNPGGRPKVPDEIKKLRQMTYQEFLDALQKYGVMTREDVEAHLKRKETTCFEHIFGKVIIDACDGEKDARNLLIERLWGKVKESYDLNLNSISDEELVLLGKAAIAQIEGSK